MGITNGVTVTNVTLPAVGDNGLKMAVKLSGKTIKEVYSLSVWSRASVDKFEAGDLNIEDAKIDVDGEFSFKTDNNGDIDMSSFTLLGVTSLDKIAVDNVVEVYVDNTTNKITKLTVGTKTVTGACTKANADNDAFTIDGTEYDYVGAVGDEPEIGETGIAYLNYDGEIAYWTPDEATAGNYGIFLGARVESGTTVASGVTMVGLVLKDGTVKEYELTSSTKCVATSGTEYKANPTSAGLTADSIVTYSFDSKGKISKLVAQTNTAVSAGAGGVAKVSKSGKAIGSTAVSENVVVFFKDGSDWTIGSMKDIDTDLDFLAAGLTINKNARDNNKIVALALKKSEVTDSDVVYALINGLGRAANDGTPTWYIEGIIDGVAVSQAFIDGETDSTTRYIASTMGADGLYEVKVDASGVITSLVTNTTVTETAVEITKEINTTTKEVTVSGGAVYALTDDVKVYYYDKDKEEYSVSSLDKIGTKKYIQFMVPDDGEYTVVMWWNK